MVVGQERSMVEKFTKVLYELLVDKELSLKSSLEIVAGKISNIHFSRTGTEKIASYVLEEMLSGASFSNSLRKCPYVNFDDVYISFINFAEKTGRIGETFDFLNKRCERKKENYFKIIEVGIYPIFVVLLAAVGSLYLYFSRLISVNFNIFIYLGFLFIFSFGIFWGIKKTICEDTLYEAFLAVGFLIRSGVSLYDAVGCGAQILGVNSKMGLEFLNAREKLLLGMNLKNAFCIGSRYSDAFFFAEKSGGKADVFEKLAKYIGEKDEKKRSVCFSLIEPVFMLITGIFLMILIVNIFLPYISNYSFM